MALSNEQQKKVLALLNEASDILEEKVTEVDELEFEENILCPLGEVISNVEGLDVVDALSAEAG